MRDLAANNCGTTAIEYALIATLLSILLVTGAAAMGTTVSGFFVSAAASLH
ncbi:MAG: hypothetical protein JWP16_1695 [Alphaproteobacteria bacterium]|nr:hypothetical protein [Alphaproteobacteria bacterium]MDB5740655.1 hypothetical protein [Alphaproteobacteria bacterium]